MIKYANKQDKSELFNKNKNIIFDLLKYLPVTLWQSNDYEADDIIYTLCKDLQSEEIIVLSNDSDFIQLLQEFDNIKIYNPIKKTYMTKPMYHYVVWKSLAGDKSDNIPKIISDKKAEVLASNPEKLRIFLTNEEIRANFSINYELIKFKCIDYNDITITYGSKNYDILFDKFKEYDFKSLLNNKTKDTFISTFENLS